TKREDWAAGAGTLQYDEPGESYTIEEYLQKMMSESDNVATNALIRLAGGTEYVSSVARDLGAEDTLLYQPVSSERAAVPSLDNRTTPRDMAKMLAAIESGEAVEGRSEEMLALLGTNEFEDGIENGLPEGAEVKNKGGWLYRVYADAGVVEHEDERYVVSIFSKYGPATREGGEITDRISEEVWEIQKEEE
ncbi:MAG: class A beta-lactamase-related serine hydrolase, partial [Rubrobacter sp.]|nr:class A beta-lactamase-related serine hydrolase [Rubrobacter sp.]